VEIKVLFPVVVVFLGGAGVLKTSRAKAPARMARLLKVSIAQRWWETLLEERHGLSTFELVDFIHDDNPGD